MRIVFGVLSLLVVVAIVGILAKKNLGTAVAPVAVPAMAGASSPLPSTAPTGTVQQQSQQVQQQVKQAVEGALQQARPMPDEK